MSPGGPIGGFSLDDIEGSMEWFQGLRKHCDAFKALSTCRVQCNARPALVKDSKGIEHLMVVIEFSKDDRGIH